MAGLYCVSTVPDARRQGIGAAMTWVALQQAREQGYHVGVLQSSPPGLRVYQDLGFRPYATFSLYLGAGA